MKKTIFILSILFAFSACTHPAKDMDKELAVIDFGGNVQNSASDILSLSFLKLQTSDNCLLGAVSQIRELKGYYYLLDAFVSRKAYVFDKQGNFVTMIGNTGNAPGEYISPSSLLVDEVKGILSVVDPSQHKIINYSLDDYHFLSESKIPFSSSFVEKLSDNELAWYVSDYQGDAPHYGVYVTDNDVQTKKKLLELEFVSAYKLGMNRKIYSLDHSVYAYSHYSPVLYHVQSDSVSPVYEFRFGKYQYPSLDFFQKEGANFKNYINVLMESSYVNFYEVFESERLLCVPYFVEQTMYFGFYDKDSGRIYNYEQKDIQEQLQVGAFSSPVGVTSDGRFVSLLRPGLLKEMKGKGIVLNKDLAKLVDESNEDDNPILLFLH